MKGAAALLTSTLLLSGCGGSGKTAPPTPKLPHAVAQRLIALVDDPAALQAQTIREVNAHRIPAALQEPLLSRVNALQADPSSARRTSVERWLRDRAD